MLPETIEITDLIAGSLVFETRPAPLHFQMPDLNIDPDIKSVDDEDLRRDLSARDRALLLCVCAMAPTAVVEDDGPVRIPDLPLRKSLGMRTRRDEWEDARFDRFARSTIKADGVLEGDDVPVPTMTKGWRRRTVSGCHLWDVDDRIRTAFAIEPGDTIVEIPMDILAGARSRYTLTMLMRVLAWGTGYHPGGWLRRKKDDHRVLRIPLDELRRELGIGDDVKPADLMRKVILPALSEIRQFTDYPVDVMPWHGPSLRPGKTGRMVGIDILVPVNGRVVPEPERKPAEIVPFENYCAGPTPGSDKDDIDIAF